MSIRAVVKDGQIRLVDPLPSEWVEGQELTVDAGDTIPTEAELKAWDQKLREGAARIPAEDHERFEAALREQEQESKDWVRREWGLT